jgi:hypothetical protein
MKSEDISLGYGISCNPEYMQEIIFNDYTEEERKTLKKQEMKNLFFNGLLLLIGVFGFSLFLVSVLKLAMLL